MRRVSSQIIFISPSSILRNCVLEQDENGVLTRIIDLQTQQSETHHTLFHEGIISSRIVSLKTELTDNKLNKIKSSYNYFDFSEPINLKLDSQKALLIDFGTSNVISINQLLFKHHKLFIGMNVFDFLKASCFLPMQILNKPELIKINHKPQLILWHNLNLIEKQLTPITTVRYL